MKLHKSLLLFGAGAILLTACGDDGNNEEDTTKEEPETEEVQEEQSNLPTEDIGEGNFYIVNQSGSSEDSDVVEFYDADLLTPSLGIEGWDMDGSHKTFIYFNGVLVAEEQIADYQGSIDIPTEQYKVGTHTVTAIQYDDDTENGEPIFVRNIPFEIKE